jgi:putative acetyltransferase
LHAVCELIRAGFWEAFDDAGWKRPDVLPAELAEELDPEELARRYDALLVAGPDGSPFACVGVRPFGSRGDGTAVMNRLYVLPARRRTGAGRALAAAAVDGARDLGYLRMVLDVIPQRTRVIAMYRALGFGDVAPFVDYPFEMVFLGRDL